EDRETGRSRGFGFVEMAEGGDAAIENLNGAMFQGRTLTVNEARPREERPARQGGGRERSGGHGRGGETLTRHPPANARSFAVPTGEGAGVFAALFCVMCTVAGAKLTYSGHAQASSLTQTHSAWNRPAKSQCDLKESALAQVLLLGRVNRPVPDFP